MHYPTGPIGLSPSDIPGYEPSSHTTPEGEIEAFAWWRRKDDTPLYQGLEIGLQRLADTIKAEGPFDGVIGFSQGGCATGILESLLESGRKDAFDAAHTQDSQKMKYPASFLNESGDPIQQPFKFAVVYSGFTAPLEYYGALYEPKITTPTLHFIGSLDTVVEESRSRSLADSCETSEDRVVVHPGGHFLPSQKVWLDTTIGFIRTCVQGTTSKKGREEVKAEDMDMPF